MAILKIISGDPTGKIFDLQADKVFTIGRDPKSSLPLNDTKASRHHAEISFENDEFFVKDMGSSNGTFINGVPATKSPLKHQDSIKIGLTVMAFEETVMAGEVSVESKLSSRKDKVNDSSVEVVEIKLDMEKEESNGDKPFSIGKELNFPKLATLYRTAKIISSEKDLNTLSHKLLEILVETTGASQGHILFLDKTNDKINIKISFPKMLKEKKISRTIVKRVAQYTRPLLTPDALLDARFAPSQSVAMGAIKSVICVPMISTSKEDGVIYLEQDKLNSSFSEEDLEFTTIVAIQMGMAFTTFRASEKAHRALASTVKLLNRVMEMKQPDIQGHPERVANFATMIAIEMGLKKHEIRNIQLAALLHDIGKITLKSTDTEAEKDKKAGHVLMAEKLLQELPEFEEILPLVKYHHERIDGDGFPDNLKGDKIPLGAKVIALADKLDDILAYEELGKKGLSTKNAVVEIQAQSDKAFDNKTIAALVKCYDKGTLFDTPTSLFDE